MEGTEEGRTLVREKGKREGSQEEPLMMRGRKGKRKSSHAVGRNTF